MENQIQEPIVSQEMGIEPEPAPKAQKLTRREKRKRWKAQKKAKRAEKKEFYRYAPPLRRWWALYFRKPVLFLLGMAVLAVLLFEPVTYILSNLLVEYYYAVKDQPLAEEDIPKIYELSPIDEEGAERIKAYPAVDKDETWAFYVYMVGSNLEDMDENDLSYVTSVLAREQKEENTAASQEKLIEHLTRYSDELKGNRLELPAFFFYPDKPVASSKAVTEDVVVADRPGASSTDIAEITSEAWSDNISVVIQTGGATRWSNQMVNPNRTQRFLYKGGRFSQVADLPLVPSSEPDTLSDFLRFCQEEYPADHTALILWNHGGGPFGYGNDSIYNGALSLRDIRTALSDVYTPDMDNPPYDIIGFDACLMSSIEVTHALEGFGRFYCLSEESEPGDGWDYAPVLRAMTDDPTMSPASVAQKIADSYTDFYMREDINQSLLEWDVTFSVIDAEKAAELYDAYAALCQAQLQDAAGDLSVLAEIGRCSEKATRFAGANSHVFNMVDLGNYMDYLSDSYPEECGRVRDLVREAVLYHRENGGLGDSTGISVYVPGTVKDIYGLAYFLDYVYDISEDDSISALYYYKQAGCLNEELQKHLAQLTKKEPKVLDVSEFRAFSTSEPEFDEEGFLIPVSEELQSLLVNYELEAGKYDEAKHTVTYYGREACLSLDGEGYLASSFDGTWICLGGEPLYVEVVSTSPNATDYRAHVYYNEEEAYLEITCDRDTDEMRVTGIRKVPDDTSPDVNFLSSTRSNEEVAYGAKIAPIYVRTDFSTNTTENIKGKTITFLERTPLRRELLPAGYYLHTAVIMDPRGDSYYSRVIGANIQHGGISGWAADPRFIGSDY